MANPEIIKFLMTCEIKTLEYALMYRKEKVNDSFKDWLIKKIKFCNSKIENNRSGSIRK